MLGITWQDRRSNQYVLAQKTPERLMEIALRRKLVFFGHQLRGDAWAKFTGDGDINLHQWLRNFDRCCVIAEKSDDLVVGQILMLCVDGRAKAILDQFEDEKGSPQKYSELKEQLAVVFDSETDREAHMTAFERCIQKIDESEEEFMTHLLQLFRAANPKAKTDIINHAVKRKFLQGISDTLRRNIFIFCTNPYDDKITHQDLLKACRDASVHLSLPSATINGAIVTGPSDAVLTAANPSDTTLDAILALSTKFEQQSQLTMRKLDEQQDQINALNRTLHGQQIPMMLDSGATPSLQDNIAFITPNKYTILPGQSLTIKTVANGPSLHAFRPVSEPTALIDGHAPFEERLHVKVVPYLHKVSHQHSCVPTVLVNTSAVAKTIKKGTKVALGTYDFEEFSVLPKDTINLLSTQDTDNSTQTSDPITILTSQLTHLSPSQFQQAKNLLMEFSDVFSLSNTKIGKTNVTEFDFDLAHSTPISITLRRVPLHQQSIVKELLQHYKAHGLIEHIDSPYRAATVLVAKKNVSNSCDVTDRFRLVVDYRFLNPAIKDSGWPSPSLQQCLDSVRGSQYVSSIDFNSGYHQIPCADRIKPIIAFSPGYGFGQWTWNVMPQGIKPASSLFQRTMEQTFSDLSDCILPPFYDDVVIKGLDFTDHLSNVRRVLARIRQSGLTLNALKCKFFQTSLPYLGHFIDKGHIRLDPARIQSITDFPVPSNAKSLKEFLGMAQFCDRFVPHFSVVAAPLHELAKPTSTFVWTPEAQAAFEALKQLLSSAPVLRAPTSTDSFILEVDASDRGEGACLKATNTSDGKTYIVAYASRKFNETESRWNIVEKEAHAIIFATEKFRHYLLGVRWGGLTVNNLRFAGDIHLIAKNAKELEEVTSRLDTTAGRFGMEISTENNRRHSSSTEKTSLKRSQSSQKKNWSSNKCLSQDEKGLESEETKVKQQDKAKENIGDELSVVKTVANKIRKRINAFEV
eukprot:gene9397-biopygen10865